jgi:hypothetical protein
MKIDNLLNDLSANNHFSNLKNIFMPALKKYLIYKKYISKTIIVDHDLKVKKVEQKTFTLTKAMV